MTIHSSRSGNNRNHSSAFVQAGQGNSAESEFNNANGSDNEAQPANRELERSFGIRIPQRKQRTTAEKRAMITPEMLEKALSETQLAAQLEIPVKTLKSRIYRIQSNDYPDFITLPGSACEWLSRSAVFWLLSAV